jgi:hypothetical protein
MDSHGAKATFFAGVLCAVAVLFYCVYTQSFDAVGLLILLVFFAYFRNLKFGSRGMSSPPSPAAGQVVRFSPLRELAKALGCLVAGGIGVGIGLRIPDVQMGVALALTAAVVGLVGFMLYLLRAATAQ